MSRSRSPRSRVAHRAAPLTVALLLVLTACTPGDGDDATTEEHATGQSSDAITETDVRDSAAAPVEQEPEDHEQVEERPPRLPLPDVDDVLLRSPATGAGTHPTLAWEPVPDAARYHVTVIDDDGRTVWAWTTDGTEVILGGYEEPPPEHVRGPQLYAPMHWHVLARDAEDRIIAQSGLRPIAP